jgi:hypothetical protein
MPSDVMSSRRRENTWSLRTSRRFSMSSLRRMVSPVRFTLEILYCSPSSMPATIDMSRLSALISTWVLSMLKST